MAAAQPYAELVAMLEEVEAAVTSRPLRTAVARVRRSISAGTTPAGQAATSLCAQLRSRDADDWANMIEHALATCRKRVATQFKPLLNDACAVAGLPFKLLSSGVGVGPFTVLPDLAKDTVRYEYAKVELPGQTAAEPAAIVHHARTAAAELLAAPADVPALADRFITAMLHLAEQARQPTNRPQLRVSLPAVYEHIAQQANAGRRRNAKTPAYAVPRFVVELKTLLQSPHNMAAPKRIKLETAVIDNTGKSGASVFIPHNLNCGYGEGVYYQAIILLQ